MLNEMQTLRALSLAFALSSIWIRPATPASETVLHTFEGRLRGSNPYAGVIRDPAGNLYGTTFYGGAANAGVVYKIDATGRETVLYSFTGGNDGNNPLAGVVRDPAGNLYGTTISGGASQAGCRIQDRYQRPRDAAVQLHGRGRREPSRRGRTPRLRWQPLRNYRAGRRLERGRGVPDRCHWPRDGTVQLQRRGRRGKSRCGGDPRLRRQPLRNHNGWWRLAGRRGVPNRY